MTDLRRRLGKLERGQPSPSPFDAMDPVLAALSKPELLAIGSYDRAVRHGWGAAADETRVHELVRDRLAAVGIRLP